MYLNLKNWAILSSVIALSACASGQGDFDVVSVSPTTNSQATAPAEPKTQDDNSSPRAKEEALSKLQEPGYGFGMKIPKRNRLPNEPHAVLDTNKMVTLSGGTTLSIPFLDEVRKRAEYPDYDVIHSHDGKDESRKQRDSMEFVRSGYVMNKYAGTDRTDGFRQGHDGYVYYLGIKPSANLPTGKSITYKGTWDFVSDAKAGRDRDGFSNDPIVGLGAGDSYGVTSEIEYTNKKDKSKPLGHTSEFTVDFDSKSLTGKLNRNGPVKGEQQDIVTRYNIEAKIHGNRFRGKAMASNPNDLYFGKNSDNLEGGFFGPNAEEMAGKFMANDNSLFGVFAAKRESNSDIKTEKSFDSERIQVKSESGSLSLTQETADTFGNAVKLLVDGKSFPLLPESTSDKFSETLKHSVSDNKNLNINVCCSNLDYIKFGNYFFTNSNNEKLSQDYAYFLNGERTSESKVAEQKGSVKYLGSWEGTLVSADNRSWVSGADKANRADLDFNFDNKTFKGGLYVANNTATPVLDLSGNISGNGFSGTAKTASGGFVIDAGGSGNLPRVNISNATVQGGFYGPNAQEVGGTVFSTADGKDKVGAVFGAKRQVVVK